MLREEEIKTDFRAITATFRLNSRGVPVFALPIAFAAVSVIYFHYRNCFSKNYAEITIDIANNCFPRFRCARLCMCIPRASIDSNFLRTIAELWIDCELILKSRLRPEAPLAPLFAPRAAIIRFRGAKLNDLRKLKPSVGHKTSN